MNGSSDPYRHLAALADGSLSADKEASVQSRLEAHPELVDALDEQRRAVELLRAIDVPAPPQLRARVETGIAEAASAQPRRRVMPSLPHLRPLPAITGTLAAIACAVVLIVIIAGGSAAPTIAQAASLGARPAMLPAPTHNTSKPALLKITTAGVPYPYWEDEFGWRAIGVRNDKLGGRKTTTVFYRNGHGQRIAYSIVSGGTLSYPKQSTWQTRHGVHVDISADGSRTIVSWQRDGHSCVLSGVNVRPAALVALASWRDGGALPY